ncbi:hypothetical protein ABEB36_014762 [Hypothenemus hampei]|uniref:Ribosomal protein L1 n=1 Tax=Hypothenemus hampei TaxID=57062 RepID=A0ABD1E2S8_HYPHA
MKSAKVDSESKIKREDVKNAIQGVIKFATENPRLQNKLFNEEFPLFLQINCFKIPKIRGQVKQLYRIPLAHSPLPEDADICLIVPEVKGIPNKEIERHVEHYEELFKSKGMTNIKKIMTFYELRTEYGTFELKNRLVDLYDIFLVDGRISGKVVHKCGSIFYKKRKVPVAVNLSVPKLKETIERAVKKAFLLLSFKSDSHSVQIGHSKMGLKSLTDNALSVVTFINNQFPGKIKNIRSLNIFAHRGSSIPIYLSLENPNQIEVPQLKEKKPKFCKTVQGDLTTINRGFVVVKPSGTVKVKKSKIYNKNKVLVK